MNDEKNYFLRYCENSVSTSFLNSLFIRWAWGIVHKWSHLKGGRCIMDFVTTVQNSFYEERVGVNIIKNWVLSFMDEPFSFLSREWVRHKMRADCLFLPYADTRVIFRSDALKGRLHKRRSVSLVCLLERLQFTSEI